MEFLPDSELTVASGSSASGAPDGKVHRHNNVEMMFTAQANGAIVLGGERHPIEPQQLVLFWAGVPHRLDVGRSGRSLTVVHVPMQQLFRMCLPREFIHTVMKGRLMTERPPALPADMDAGLFAQWRSDLLHAARGNNSRTRERIVAMEVQARLKRLALNAGPAEAGEDDHASTGDEGHVEKMVRFLTENYQLPLRVQDVAERAGLNSNYAGTLFHKAMGVTVTGFLSQLRVLHAQRMLSAGDEKVLVVAMDSGFQTVSQFHAVFKRLTGQTPAEFRRRPAKAVKGRLRKADKIPENSGRRNRMSVVR